MIAQESQLQVAAQSIAMPALPPSERDFEIYNLVVIEGETTREAARALEISQTRVVQITSRVAEWIGTEVPPTPRLAAAQRLAVAADIAARRFDFLYSQAMESWRQSKGPHITLRTGGMSGGESSVTRESHGDPRYLTLAMRIAERTVRLATTVEKAAAVGEQMSEVESQRSAVGDRKSEDLAKNPPGGECSGLEPAAARQAEAAPMAVAASDCEEKLSDDKRRQRKVFFGGSGGQIEACSADVRPGQRDGQIRR